MERISDHQLDVLHRLSEQFRLVTASINTSSSAVRQAMEETTTRQDQASQLQFQQLLARLQCFSAAAIARPQVASAQIQEEGEDRFVMPTPPASQLPKALRKPSMPIIVEQPTASSSSHRCLAVECTSCLIQETPSSTQERSAMMVVITREGNGQNGVSPSDGRIPQHLNQASQGSETQLSTMPPPPVAQVELNGISRTMPLLPSSPNRQSNSPTRSNISKTRRSVKPMQPFVLKKRTIPQPEDEEEERVPEANEEEQVQDVEKIVEETQERQREVMPRSTIADRFALAYEKVEAWRYGTAAGQSTAISSNSALVTNQTCSFQADQNNDSPLASSSLAVLPETPAADVPSITRRSARANSKSKTAGTSLAPASKRAKRS